MTSSGRSARRPVRSGMTLIEMLVATAATLILMGALAQVFSVFGSAVSNSRSMIEQDSRLRSVAWRLRSDLAGATARMLPPLKPEAGEGYFEIIEGPQSDAAAADGTTTLAGDIDDVLLFTTQSSEAAFIGKAGTLMVESPTAEVAWFLRQTGTNSSTAYTPTTYTLFRRQLLVVGYSGFGEFVTNNTITVTGSNFFDAYFDAYDVSARLEGTKIIPNTLTDLTRRESRFMHNITGDTTGAGFPYAFPTGTFQRASPPAGLIFDSAVSSTRVGEDVVLTNVIAFDVRVFDPAAPVSVSGNDAQAPGDPGFAVAVTNGAFVDLGNLSTIDFNNTLTARVAPHFSGYGDAKSQLVGSGLTARTWDTWSTHYETNGVNDDGDSDIDEGSNGLDDNSNGETDESTEKETSPPYPYPLRGIEVRIRCYEPSSRQVRQITVRNTFVPH